MRGLAVIIMVIGHSIDSVLSVEARATEWFRLYTVARGFTAPMFLFVSGLAFMIATQKRWEAYLRPGIELTNRLLKITLLFGIGYALHFPFFSLNKIIRYATPEDLAGFFQVDILQCVAMCLLLMHVIILVTRDPRRFAVVSLALTIGIVTLTPLVWRVDVAPFVTGFFAPYFNETPQSLFPLFPYAAFLLGGAVAGHFFIAAREKGREREFFVVLFWGSVVMVACGLLMEQLPFSLYPPHDFWKTNPGSFFIRLGIVMLLTTGFYFLRAFPQQAARHVVKLGQASLLVYVVHLVIVYGSAANNGLAQIVGRGLSSGQALAVGLFVLLGMLLLSHGWTTIRTHHVSHSKLLQVAVASLLLFFFFVNPY